MKPRPIKDKKKIALIFEKGSVVFGKYMILRFHVFENQGVCYGISVPKKKILKAVDRNKIKRRIRVQLKNILNKKPIMYGCGFFILYNSSDVVSSRSMEKECTYLLSHL